MKGLTLDWENKYWDRGYEHIVGVDEAGRGAMAGPVAAAAVGMNRFHKIIKGINDSKQLTDKQRQRLAQQIKEEAEFWAVGLIASSEIDREGIATATYKAMYFAVSWSQEVNYVWIDGNVFPKLFAQHRVKGKAIVRGDQLIYSVACASILAKTERDKHMIQLATNFPGYLWEDNKGYGTKTHYQAIKRLGLTPCHRESFTFRRK